MSNKRALLVGGPFDSSKMCMSDGPNIRDICGQSGMPESLSYRMDGNDVTYKYRSDLSDDVNKVYVFDGLDNIEIIRLLVKHYARYERLVSTLSRLARSESEKAGVR